MRAFLPIGLFGVAIATMSVAHADDAACSIRILEAPPEALDAIAGWAAGERTCTTLEVRVVPTGEGYSLWARTHDGRTFTRWVPSAKTAALLVVSWAGDDSLPAADPPHSSIVLRTHVRQMLPEQPAQLHADIAPTPRDVLVAAIVRPGSGEDIQARTGIRVSADLAVHDAWRMGLAGMLSDEKVNIYGYNTYRAATAYEPRASLIGYLARDVVSNHIRLSAGAGVLYTQLSDVVMEPGVGDQMVDRMGILAPAAELSAMFRLPLSERWALSGGTVLTLSTDRTHTGLLIDPDQTFAPDHDQAAQLVVAFGVSRSM
jgi:hypothetical protein